MSVMPRDETVLQYQHPPEDDRAAYAFRAEQLAHRRQEVSATLDLFQGEAAEGKDRDGGNEDGEKAMEEEKKATQTITADKNLWRQTSGREYTGRRDLLEGPDDDPLPVLRKAWNQSGQLVGIMGHSFGAATSLLASQQDSRIGSVLTLDPWMFPLPDDFATSAHQNRALPMLSINSSLFHWPVNLQALRAVLERNTDLGSSSVQISIASTRHMDQSDFPSLVPAWLASRFRSQPLADPHDTLRLNTQLSLAFHQHALRPQAGTSGQPSASSSSDNLSLRPFEQALWDPAVVTSPAGGDDGSGGEAVAKDDEKGEASPASRNRMVAQEPRLVIDFKSGL